MNQKNRMFEIAKRILIEVELKNTFSTINIGDKINIVKVDDTKYTFTVQSNISGKIIMKDSSKKSLGKTYVLDKSSLDDDKLTIYLYDRDAVSSDFKGDKLTMEIKSINILNNKTGDIKSIDVGSDEKQFKKKEDLSRVDEYNRLIKELEKDDELIITTETKTEEDEDSIVNDLIFKVIDVKEDNYVLNLTNIEGDSDGEKSQVNKKLMSNVSSKPLYVGREGFFNIINDDVTLTIRFGKNNKIPIKGVIDVSIGGDDVYDDTSDDDYEDEIISNKNDFTQWLDNNPKYKNMVNKTPGFFGTLAGASPKGIAQLQKLIKTSATNNSYLTKGNYVVFKLMSGNIYADLSHKLLNRKDKSYEAKVVGDKLLKIGDRRSGFWEIKLLDELEDNTYKSEVKFCKSNGSCDEKTKNARIKIINIKKNR